MPREEGEVKANIPYSKLDVSDISTNDQEEDHSDYMLAIGLSTFLLVSFCIVMGGMMSALTFYDFYLVQDNSPLRITPNTNKDHKLMPCIWRAQIEPAPETYNRCNATSDYFCPKLYSCNTLSSVPFCESLHFDCSSEKDICTSFLQSLQGDEETSDSLFFNIYTAPDYSMYLQLVGLGILLVCFISYIVIAVAVCCGFKHGLSLFCVAYGFANVATDILFAGGMIYAYSSVDLCYYQCFDHTSNELISLLCNLQGIIALLSYFFGVFLFVQLCAVLVVSVTLCCICVYSIIHFVYRVYKSFRVALSTTHQHSYELTELNG